MKPPSIEEPVAAGNPRRAVTPFMPTSLLGRLSSLGAGEAEVVPQSRLLSPMPWVVAIMVALTVIAAAAGLALSNIAGAARAELSGGLTVQILEAQPDLRSRQAAASLAVLQSEPGVSGVRQVPDAEVDALLSPWLGSNGGLGVAGASQGSVDTADVVPVPALIDAHLDGTIAPERLAALRARILHVAPAARIDAQASWLRPVFGAIASLQMLALALMVLLAAAMASAVLLAARSALGNQRGTIEIVHMLGGTDGQIARIFARAFGLDAALGGALGGGIAVVVIVVLGGRFAGLGAGLVAGGALTWFDWAGLVLIPLAGVGLAMLTARQSVLGALRKML